MATASPRPDQLLSRKEVYEEFGLSQNLLEKLAVRGGGPAMIKISARMVRYSRSDIQSWLASKRIENTGQFDADRSDNENNLPEQKGEQTSQAGHIDHSASV